MSESKEGVRERLRAFLRDEAGLKDHYAQVMSNYVMGFALLSEAAQGYVEHFVRHSTREIVAFLKDLTVPGWILEELRITEEEMKARMEDLN